MEAAEGDEGDSWKEGGGGDHIGGKRGLRSNKLDRNATFHTF